MRKCMQPAWAMLLVIPACLSILLTSQTASAENIKIRSESIVRFLERDTIAETDALVIPAYEYLQVDIGDPGKSALTFHANGWGRADLVDNDYFSNQTAGELLYGYLEYRPTGKSLIARLGRQSVFAGVASESIDGVYLDTALATSLKFSVYAGQPVSLDSSNGRSGDVIYGGRLSMRQNHLDLGLSYKLIENDSTDAEEMVGVDYGFMLNNFFIGGISSYNLMTDDFAEHSFDAVFTAADNRFHAFYQLFSFADYFGTGANNANPFRVLAQSSEELSSYGLEVTRKFSASAEAGIKLTRNDYDLKESSNYLAVLANWIGEKASYGGELGLSEGENGRNDMMLVRGFALMNIKSILLDQISIDLLYATYDQPIFGEDTSIFASVSGNRELSDNLRLKVSADYESNPYYDSDVRGLVSLVYNYSAN